MRAPADGRQATPGRRAPPPAQQMMDLASDPAVLRLITTALAEDIGCGDVTTQAALAADLRTAAKVIAQAPCIVAGVSLAPLVYHQLDSDLVVDCLVGEGAAVVAGQAVVRVVGLAAPILAGERVLLNLIQHLSGIATMTRKFVDAVAGTDAVIVDTRKTTPGLRLLEKHAVCAGGGVNHRLRLDDGVLIKNTHVALGGGTAATVQRVRAHAPSGMTIQVECRSADEVEEALAAGADALLLDNQSVEEAGALMRLVGGRAVVEISGGVTLANVAAYAATGAQRISIGALTHSAPAVPLHLRIEATA